MLLLIAATIFLLSGDPVLAKNIPTQQNHIDTLQDLQNEQHIKTSHSYWNDVFGNNFDNFLTNYLSEPNQRNLNDEALQKHKKSFSMVGLQPLKELNDENKIGIEGLIGRFKDLSQIGRISDLNHQKLNKQMVKRGLTSEIPNWLRISDKNFNQDDFRYDMPERPVQTNFMSGRKSSSYPKMYVGGNLKSSLKQNNFSRAKRKFDVWTKFKCTFRTSIECFYL